MEAPSGSYSEYTKLVYLDGVIPCWIKGYKCYEEYGLVSAEYITKNNIKFSISTTSYSSFRWISIKHCILVNKYSKVRKAVYLPKE